MQGNAGCERTGWSRAWKAPTGAPEERPAAHQLVGGARDHLGYDGYPASEGGRAQWD